jgi:hypothetical protein
MDRLAVIRRGIGAGTSIGSISPVTGVAQEPPRLIPAARQHTGVVLRDRRAHDTSPLAQGRSPRPARSRKKSATGLKRLSIVWPRWPIHLARARAGRSRRRGRSGHTGAEDVPRTDASNPAILNLLLERLHLACDTQDPDDASALLPRSRQQQAQRQRKTRR